MVEDRSEAGSGQGEARVIRRSLWHSSGTFAIGENAVFQTFELVMNLKAFSGMHSIVFSSIVFSSIMFSSMQFPKVIVRSMLYHLRCSYRKDVARVTFGISKSAYSSTSIAIRGSRADVLAKYCTTSYTVDLQ